MRGTATRVAASPRSREPAILVPTAQSMLSMHVAALSEPPVWTFLGDAGLASTGSFSGGGTLLPSNFAAEESFEAFVFENATEAAGSWLLEVNTLPASPLPANKRLSLVDEEDGRGGAAATDGVSGVATEPATLSSWALRLDCGGHEIELEPSLVVRVHSFPSGGRLLPAENLLADARAHVLASAPLATLASAPLAAFAALPQVATQCAPGDITHATGGRNQEACSRAALVREGDGASAWTGDASAYLAALDADAHETTLMRLNWAQHRHSVVVERFDDDKVEARSVFSYSLEQPGAIAAGLDSDDSTSESATVASTSSVMLDFRGGKPPRGRAAILNEASFFGRV